MKLLRLILLAALLTAGTAHANDDYFFLRLGLQKTDFNSSDEMFDRMESTAQAHITLGWVKPLGNNFYFDFTVGHESYPSLGDRFGGNGEDELIQNWYGFGLEYRWY